MTPRYRSSKYNQPDTVKGRFTRGDRRWSFWIGKKKDQDKPSDTILDHRYVTVEEVSFYYGPPSLFYSCDCPDYQRVEVAQPALIDEADYQGATDTPKIFSVDNYSRYLSSYMRYQRGSNLVAQVEFIGTSGLGNIFNYRIPTNRIQKRDRDWSSSSAGIYPNFCKHIWAVVIYRGDPYEIPDDIPENFSFEDLG
jgi:hypothetical protein